MAIEKLQIGSILDGISPTQYFGSDASYNSAIAVDPDFPTSASAIRTSGMLVPTRYEEFSSSSLIGNPKWMTTTPKDTKLYVYTDNPSSASSELSATSLFGETSLVAYWKLEDANDSKASYNLTNNNTVTFAAAKFTNGADLGSANTNKSLTINSQFGIGATDSRSYSFWVKRKAEISSGTETIFWTANSDARVNYLIDYEYNAGTRRLRFRRFKPNVNDDAFSYNITMGTSDFYHIVMTYDGSTLRGYVNGASVGSVSSSGTGTGSETAQFHMGYSESSQYSSVIFDDFAVFNKSLSAAEILNIYSNGARLMSYSSSLASETLVASPASATANGMAYYNNYLYIATNTDIDRYGPLDGTPAYTASVWTGATLGSQPALVNTSYPTLQGVTMPNHSMHVHTDNTMYICDYNTTANPGKGSIHRIRTSKTTNEGDTNNSSDNDVLALPFGFRPVDIESFNTDLAILAIQTSDTVVNQGKAALFLWDTTSISFYAQVSLPDHIATALLNVNGVLYIWSGNSSNGVRLSRYTGGYGVTTIAYLEEGTPPFSGAVKAIGDKVLWGGWVSLPESAGVVFSFGSKDPRLPQGVSCPVRSSVTGTTPHVMSLETAQQANNIQPRLVLGAGDGTSYNLDKLSTTGTYDAIWRSKFFNFGKKFCINKIGIPLGNTVDSNTSITVKVYIDDLSSSSTLTTINNTNYSGKRKVVYKQNDLASCIGQNNFLIEIAWAGTTECPVLLPISIDVDVMDDEN